MSQVEEMQRDLVKTQSEYIQEFKTMIELKDKYISILERQLEFQDKHIIKQDDLIDEMKQSIKTLVSDHNSLSKSK